MPVHSNGIWTAGERLSVLKRLTVRNVFAWEVKSFIDQVCSVKMAEYWPRSFFASLLTSTSSRSIDTQKKNLANIQPSWPHTWSITHTYKLNVDAIKLHVSLLVVVVSNTQYSYSWYWSGTSLQLRFMHGVFFQIFKDVRAHCYCASLVHTLFVGHAHATSFSSVRTDSKTQQNIERMIFALTWCANIFVGCSVTPTFFSADQFLFWFFPLC